MTDSRCTRSTVPWIWFNIYTRWKVHMKCHMLHVNGIRGFFFSLPLRIIYPCAHDMPYTSAIFLADLPTMSDRRDQLTRKLFKTTTQPTSSLHYFLPPPRDHPSITRLRVPSKFPRITTRTTKKHQSLILPCSLPLSDVIIVVSLYLYCFFSVFVFYILFRLWLLLSINDM